MVNHERGCETDEVLSAHLDDDLEPEHSARIEAHLGGCADCRAVLDELGAMRTDLKALADVAPERDLWPAIQDRRSAEEGSGWLARLQRWWALPAAAVAGAVATLLLVWFLGSPTGPGAVEPGAKPEGPVKALTAVLDAERVYGDAIASLDRAMQTEKSRFSPEVRSTIEQGLADIDRTIEKCRAALKTAPDDLGAHEAMLAAYQHKVDFMTELLGESL